MQNPCTEIIGTYITTIRKDFSNGYTVFYISCKNYDEYKINGKILCAGRLPITTRGVPLKLTGYFEKTKRRIVFEYIELDINTNADDAKRLKELCKGISYHFNLIPINTTPRSIEECPALKPPSKQKQAEFWEELKKQGISATTRRTLGSDIDGACGQLRRSYKDKKETK